MTRFARIGQNNKRPQDATKWSEMKSGGADNSQPPSDSNQRKEPDIVSSKQEQTTPNSPLKGVKNSHKFKPSKEDQKHKKQWRNKQIQSGGSKRPKEFECYHCHERGHRVSECPTAPPGSRPPEVECYVCKQKGHKSFKCPKAPQMSSENRKYNPSERKNKVDWKKRRAENKGNTNWKKERSDKRRLKRQDQSQAKTHCFNCRESGHKLSECPELQNDVEQGTDICFKCGSTEHTVKKCRLKLAPGEFPYAKCFICGETGHLSQKCPDNPRGLYPNGGCCRTCGSVEHLQRDCPEFQKKQGIESITLKRIGDTASADMEIQETGQKSETVKPTKTGPKVVKF